MSLGSPQHNPRRRNDPPILLEIPGVADGTALAIQFCDKLQSKKPFDLICAGAIKETIMRHKEHFIDALPTLLGVLPDLRRAARTDVVQLIANRPHWISTEHLNERLIPLLLQNGFMKFDGPTVVRPLVHVVGINAARVHANHIPSIFDAVWRRIQDAPRSSWEGVYLAPFGQRTPPQFLARTTKAMCEVLEMLTPILRTDPFCGHSRGDTVNEPLVQQALNALDAATSGLFAHRTFFQGKLECPDEALTAKSALLGGLRKFVASATDEFLKPTASLRLELLMPVLCYPRVDSNMPPYIGQCLERLRLNFLSWEPYRPLADQIHASLNSVFLPGDARFPAVLPESFETNALLTANTIETCVHAWSHGQMPKGDRQRGEAIVRLQQIGSTTLRAPVRFRADEGLAVLVGYDGHQDIAL